MTELFDRRAVLTLRETGGDGLVLRSFVERAGRVEEGLHIAFEVSRTVGGDANTAAIDVYNLARETRDRAHERFKVVQLEAGYGDQLKTVYEGEIAHAWSERAGPGFVTHLECSDGGDAFATQTVEQTFPAGTRVRDVIKLVAGAFTQPTQDVENEPVRFGKAPKKPKTSRIGFRSLDADLSLLDTELRAQGFSLVLRRPMSVSGNAREALDRLARMWRFDWSVQDGKLQIAGVGKALVGEDAIRLTPESGLVGSPTRTEYGVRLQALLVPELYPGRQLLVESESVSGRFRAELVDLGGDTRGDRWGVDVEARGLDEL